MEMEEVLRACALLELADEAEASRTSKAVENGVVNALARVFG
jgi:hypothetical protein